MKYLGIDYGSKRIGIAASNAEGTIAFPRKVIRNDDGALAAIREICDEEKVEKIVIGDTRTVGGAANPITKEAEQFAERLRQGLALPVATVFEAWSSIEASRYAEKGGEHDDAAAAAIILQRYLDIH